VDEYCRQMKTMADTLRTLGAPITDECLVLNLLRSLSPRFDRVTPILTRMKPFPTFAETKNDLLLEELRLSATATAAPAMALYIAPRAPPLCLRRDPLHRTPVSRRLELFGSLLATGGVAVVAAEAIHRVAPSGHPSTTRGLALSKCGSGRPRAPRPLSPSPRHPSGGFLCRSTSGGALGTSPASTGAPSPPRASGPTRVGALDQWVGHAVSCQLLHNDAGPTHLSL
jgi:hypothetical protein